MKMPWHEFAAGSVARREPPAPLDGACGHELAAIAEQISLTSPVYAEQMVDRIVARLRQAQDFSESGRTVPEAGEINVRELYEWPYRVIYRTHAAHIEVVAIVHGRRDLGAQL